MVARNLGRKVRRASLRHPIISSRLYLEIFHHPCSSLPGDIPSSLLVSTWRYPIIPFRLYLEISYHPFSSLPGDIPSWRYPIIPSRLYLEISHHPLTSVPDDIPSSLDVFPGDIPSLLHMGFDFSIRSTTSYGRKFF